MLVFGRAGIGKSTFCRYVAYKWATSSYWPQYELLALIRLRRLTANRYPPGQRYSLIDLVKKEVFKFDLPEEDDKFLKKQFDAKKILWILDGYDEIVQNVPPHLEGLFEQLLKTPHHILTSRPYLNTLSYNVQMEITGFTDENIEAYVQQFFDQMKGDLDDALTKSQTLLSYLKSKSSIWGVAHIPVNLELICSLWSNEDWSATEQLTMTTLYSMMTEWLCRRYLTAQDIPIQKIGKNEVYRQCQKELAFLESLAFNAMTNNTIIIRPFLLEKALDEVKVSLQDHPHILNIGILKSFNKQGTGTQIETDKDHYFVHLSFQEYFAARYLINALKGSSTEKAIEFIKHQKYNQRFALVFTFAAGLLDQSDPKTCLNIYWDSILGQPMDLVGIKYMQLVISCIEETSEKSTLPRRTELLQWIAECIEHSFSMESEILREHLSQSLQRAQSVACDEIIINIFINLLKSDTTEEKATALSFVSEMKISNPSTTLIISIISALDDKNKKVRANACYALGNIGEKAASNEVISKLVSVLGDDTRYVRENACIALGKIGAKAATNEVISKLVSALGDESEYVRENACQAIGKIGAKAATNEVISKLVSVLGRGAESAVVYENFHTGNFIPRATISKKSRKIPLRRTRTWVDSAPMALADKGRYVKGEACLALGKLGEKAATNEVISKLVSALGDETHDVRCCASIALRNMGAKVATNEVISELVSALEHESEYVIAYACIALGEIGEKAGTNEVISKLVSALGHESEYVRANACEALGKIGAKAATNEVISKLVSALGHESEYVRENACQAFEYVGAKAATNEVITKLVSALGEESENVRMNACIALGKMGAKVATNEVISKLVSALGHETVYIRANACEALGNIGEKAATNEVISKLVSALGDEAVYVRANACEALGKMGAKVATNEVISKLVGALGDKPGYVVENACEALGKIGEKAATNEVIRKLMNLLKSDYSLKIYSATDAVGMILSSSAVITQLDPKIIADLCLCEYGSICLKNVSVDQLIDVFFTTKDPDYLSAVSQLTLLKGAAVTDTEDKIVVYDSKEPLELPVLDLKLRQQLIEAFTDQAKRLYLYFKMP